MYVVVSAMWTLEYKGLNVNNALEKESGVASHSQYLIQRRNSTTNELAT